MSARWPLTVPETYTLLIEDANRRHSDDVDRLIALRDLAELAAKTAAMRDEIAR
jgi:hypothetical protein